MASPLPSIGIEDEVYNKLVRAVLEQVSLQTKTELSNLRSRIAHLESRIELESSSRLQLEDEILRLKEGHQPQRRSLLHQMDNKRERGSSTTSSTSSSPKSSPRTLDYDIGVSEQTESAPPPRASTTISPLHTNNTSTNPPNNNNTTTTSNSNTSHTNNTNTSNNQPPTENKRRTLIFDGSEKSVSDYKKKEWVKAPPPAGTVEFGKSSGDTVLFDTMSDRMVREGPLEKIGGTRTNWKLRWFRLQQGSMFYYKTQKEKKRIGEIVLTNCSVFRSNSKRQFEFTISVPDRDWLLCAKDDEEANQWVEAIKSCSAKGSISYV